MPTQVKQSFRTRPDHLIADFKHHLSETGEPHTWRFHTHEPPPREGVEVLLPNFLLPKRHKGRAPCPICSPNSPKYLKGHLIWSPDQGTLHAVGHCCGHAYFHNDTLRYGLKDAGERIRRREYEAFLWGNWEAPRLLSTFSAELVPQTRSYDKVVKGLKSGLTPRLAKSIYRMAFETAFLEIMEEFEGAEGTGLRTVAKPFGIKPFKGGRILKGGRSKSLEGAIKAASMLFDHLDWREEDDAVLWLCGQPSSDLRVLSERLRQAIPVLDEVRASLAALQAFLEPDNLELLTEWSIATMGQNAVRLLRHSDDSLTIWRDGQRVRHILLPKNIWDPIPNAIVLLPAKEAPLG